ncbi:hypothetical protein BJ165DRAFT_1529650 [Panaeolus papilionaceus]|nr:hypothetical protein BJ165DRAFT_1529650 [Panaeolus papilionaceus]
MEAFLAEEARARQGIHEHVVFKKEQEGEDKMSVKERRVRRNYEETRLREIDPSLDTAKFEPQLSGVWPQQEYRTFFELEKRMLAALVLLISTIEKLDTMHCAMLVHQIADIFSTISTISSSLLSGAPLPAYLPKLTDRLIYHAQAHHGLVMGLGHGLDEITLDMLMDEPLPAYSTGM